MKNILCRPNGDTGCPQTSGAANIQLSDSSCGNKGEHNILVAYASEFGTTREVAECIGQVLCQAGAAVETKWVKNIQDLENYDAVIIGSAIQYDKWMSAATEFVTTHQDSLSQLPMAYFFTCLTLSIKNEKAEQQAKAYANKLYALLPQVKPVSVGRFAGVLDYSKMPFFFRLISRGIYLIFGVKEGDYRDWGAIRSWANNVHIKLKLNPARIP